MTCPFLLRHPAGAAQLVDGLACGRLQRLSRLLRARLRRDDVVAQFARFVLVGGVSSSLYASLFLVLQVLGDQPANLLGATVSSVLANELHRRLTFHADRRVSWLTAQIEAGGVSFLGLVATSAALGWLDAAAGGAPLFVQVALVAAVTGVIGLLRFLALRWIFRPTMLSPA